MTGGTRQLAEAVASGAAEEPLARLRLLEASVAGAADVLAADAYVFAALENLASMAGVMKDFFDRTYYPVLDRINGRCYASLVCAGTDGEGAARQIGRIATGWRLRRIADPVIVRTGAQTPDAILAMKRIGQDDLGRCRELGAALANGMAAGIF